MMTMTKTLCALFDFPSTRPNQDQLVCRTPHGARGERKGVDYKPGSVIRRSVVISLRVGLSANLLRPTRVKGRAILTALLEAVPSLALHRMGFAKPPGHPDAGGLLPRLFTLTFPNGREGGMFSVALSLGLLPVPIRDHPALRCPDFPQDFASRDHASTPFLAAARFASLSAILFPSLGIYFTSTCANARINPIASSR